MNRVLSHYLSPPLIPLTLLPSLIPGALRREQIPYLILHVSYNGLQFGQNLLLSQWVDKLEAEENDNPAMWLYIGISFAVVVAVFGRRVFF